MFFVAQEAFWSDGRWQSSTWHGPQVPAVVANDNAAGTVAWSNVNNSAGSDNANASVVLGASASSQYLKGSDYTFNIPSGAIIRGIKVFAECSATVTTDLRASLMKNTVESTPNTRAIIVPSPTYTTPQTVVSDTAAVTQRTTSVTVPVGDNQVFVMMWYAEDRTATVTNANIGGQALTKLDSSANASFGNVEVWYRVNPPTGTSTLTVNTASHARDIIGTFTATNIDQSTPFRTPAKQSNAAGLSASVTVSGVQSTDLVFGALNIDATGHTLTPGANETVVYDLPNAAGSHTGILLAQAGANGGAITPSWTGSNPSDLIGFAMIASAGTERIIEFGSAHDLWGTTWTPAEINSPTFATRMQAIASASGATVSIDSVEVQVYYIEQTTGSPTDTGADTTFDSSDMTGTGSMAWSNVANLTGTPNSTFATVSLADLGSSNYLAGKNFGFAIPTGSTINGILVEYYDLSTPFTPGNLSNTALTKNGTSVTGTSKLITIAGGWQSFGGSTDLWGTTWTPAEINSSNFGAGLQAADDASGCQLEVDAMRVTIYYTPLTTAPFRKDIHRSQEVRVTGSGGASSADTRDVRVTGLSVPQTDARDVRVTGRADSSHAQDARITGRADSSSAQDVRATGQADSSVAYDVRAFGHIPSDASYNVRLVGQADSSHSQDVRVRGQADSSVSYDVRVTGQQDSSDSYNVRLISQADSSVAYDARVTGQADSSVTRDVRATGAIPVTDERDARVTGYEEAVSLTQDVRATGRLDSTITRDVRAVGEAPSQDSRDVRTTGQADSTTTRDVRATGQTDSSSSSSVRVVGQDDSATERDARATGSADATDSRDVRVTGTVPDVSTERDVRAIGQAAAELAVDARAVGALYTEDTRNIRVIGQGASSAEWGVRLFGSDGGAPAVEPEFILVDGNPAIRISKGYYVEI